MKRFNRIFTVIVFIFLYIPMIVLAVASFNAGTDIAIWKGFTFAQYGALTALRECGNECVKMKNAFKARRELFCSLLEKVPGLKFSRPSGAFYVFADISSYGLSSAEFCDRLMEEAHVAAAPGCGFGEDSFVRFSYACSDEVLKKSAALLADFCGKLLKEKRA